MKLVKKKNQEEEEAEDIDTCKIELLKLTGKRSGEDFTIYS